MNWTKLPIRLPGWMRRSGKKQPAAISITEARAECRRILDSLIQSEKKHKNLVESTPCLICKLKPDGEIIFVNNYVKTLTGYWPGELIGRNWWDIFYPVGLRGQVDILYKDLGKGDVRDYEMQLMDKKKNIHAICWNSFNVYSEDDKSLVEINGVGIDITQRKRAEEMLKAAYDDLKISHDELVHAEKLAALGTFSATVAHEIKNPLSIVMNGVEFLEAKLAGENGEVRSALKKIKESVLRADRIVQSFLMCAGPAEKKIERVDPNQLIDEVLPLFRLRSHMSNINLQFESKINDIFIDTDRDQMYHAIFNVMTNAVEAMPRGGDITIKTFKTKMKQLSKEKDMYMIEVNDTGPGMTKEMISNMFEPFLSAKRAGKALGLGLFAAKTIVNNHKGKLLVDSEKGKGTRIRIALPISESEGEI